MQNRNFLQFSNAPTSYSGYCTLRTGIVPLQDFCHLNTKTTSVSIRSNYTYNLSVIWIRGFSGYKKKKTVLCVMHDEP